MYVKILLMFFGPFAYVVLGSIANDVASLLVGHVPLVLAFTIIDISNLT